MRWFKDVFVELLNQTFTLLGFFTAWVLLEGSARKVVGVAILWSCFIWLVTLRVREPKDE